MLTAKTDCGYALRLVPEEIVRVLLRRIADLIPAFVSGDMSVPRLAMEIGITILILIAEVLYERGAGQRVAPPQLVLA
jgi:hypothetical protein